MPRSRYHNSALILPVVNGPTEGILIAAGCNVVSYLHGPGWWHEAVPTTLSSSGWYPSFLGTTRIHLFEVFGYTTISLTAIKQLATVLSARYRKTRSLSVVGSALLDLLPLVWIGAWGAKYVGRE